MFPLLVQEQLEFWPEQNFRQRIWVGNTKNGILRTVFDFVFVASSK